MKTAVLFVTMFWISGLCAAAPAQAEKPKNPEYENQWLKLRFIPRTPEQMAAFYEGRGFPDRAIEQITGACFMTVVIRNKSDKIIWLDLSDWKFTDGSGKNGRITREQWRRDWERLNVPMANRSTFGWTLLPEQRDLRPGEGVGGNITLVPSRKPLTVDMRFDTGADKQGEPMHIHMQNLRCEFNEK
jgi:hypothetical protein